MTGAFLTVQWGPLLSAGFPLREPDDEPAPVLTVEWGAKLGTSYYGYGRDLVEEGNGSRG